MSETANFFPALKKGLVRHLAGAALRTDGPFTLRSGEISAWYLDARQTTFDGDGGLLVGRCVLEVLNPHATAVGGMTLGADPIAVATSVVAALEERALKAFSVRKAEKTHGTGGRVVGPVARGDRAVVVDDTVTTGGALCETIDVLRAAGIGVVQSIALVDRSEGLVAARMEELEIPYIAIVTPADLGLA